MSQWVVVDVETARLIRNAFVPRNPRKMRNCDEQVRQAALRFIEATEHPVTHSPLLEGDSSR